MSDSNPLNSYTFDVFLIIAGSGLFVLMGWAVAHHFHQDVPTETTHMAGREYDQAVYMREVRLRHHEDIAAVVGGGRNALVSPVIVHRCRLC